MLGLAALRLAPRWAQLAALGGLALLGGWVLADGLMHLDGGAVLAALLLLAGAYALGAILNDIRRANAAALSPSGQAPGGAHAPGEAGKRDGERYAPMLPSGVSTTAGRAGRLRSFFEGRG